LYDQISTASSDDYVKAQVDLLEGQIYLASDRKIKPISTSWTP